MSTRSSWVGRLWQPFWLDLKLTATKRYDDKTTLEKAYGAVVLLLVAGAFPGMPYDYYLPMRVGVCIALYFFLAAAHRQRPHKDGWVAAVVGLIALYNPIIQVHLGVKVVWTVINALTIYLVYRARLSLEKQHAGSEPVQPDSTVNQWPVPPDTDTDNRA